MCRDILHIKLTATRLNHDWVLYGNNHALNAWKPLPIWHDYFNFICFKMCMFSGLNRVCGMFKWFLAMSFQIWQFILLHLSSRLRLLLSFLGCSYNIIIWNSLVWLIIIFFKFFKEIRNSLFTSCINYYMYFKQS